jgi:hypothetical protein
MKGSRLFGRLRSQVDVCSARPDQATQLLEFMFVWPQSSLSKCFPSIIIEVNGKIEKKGNVFDALVLSRYTHLAQINSNSSFRVALRHPGQSILDKYLVYIIGSLVSYFWRMQNTEVGFKNAAHGLRIGAGHTPAFEYVYTLTFDR